MRPSLLPTGDQVSKRGLVYRDRFSWQGPWNDETSRWHFGTSLAAGSMFLTGNLGEMRERDTFADSTSPRPEQSVRIARFPTIFGDSCLRWHGTAESALEQLLQLTQAFSPESFLSGVDLAPNHWFSAPLR